MWILAPYAWSVFLSVVVWFFVLRRGRPGIRPTRHYIYAGLWFWLLTHWIAGLIFPDWSFSLAGIWMALVYAAIFRALETRLRQRKQPAEPQHHIAASNARPSPTTDRRSPRERSPW